MEIKSIFKTFKIKRAKKRLAKSIEAMNQFKDNGDMGNALMQLGITLQFRQDLQKLENNVSQL